MWGVWGVWEVWEVWEEGEYRKRKHKFFFTPSPHHPITPSPHTSHTLSSLTPQLTTY
ncbi:hypothetical protein [Fortiea contorta]|uniref:hypothetical protein n=1 Tax=Fortiea contorta TaxID=1892405 RepID=UPI0003451FFC|nr:hypothetical protein [Fortiea contorta]